MSELKINKQTEAEKDDFLIECFYDSGLINDLLKKKYSILSGRKGSGKTAIARYFEKKSSSYGIDYSYRVSIRKILSGDDKIDRDSILFYILIKTIQFLISQNIFVKDVLKYWEDFLTQNGLQDISTYDSFVQKKLKLNDGYKLKSWLKAAIAGIGGGVETSANGNETKEYERSNISNTPDSIINSLKNSLPKGKSIIIFIDDLSDYLDYQKASDIEDDISTIRDILFYLSTINTEISTLGNNFRFVSLLRDDLFEFMKGSNINKLRSDTLAIEWDEKSFAGLLIRRLPFFHESIDEYLINPIDSLREQFPDEIFVEILKNFETNRYATNFYAYMVSVSFNRPRDFLMFCYALRDRLSMKHPAELENIESAEIEYSDYFIKELRDELYLASKMFDFDADRESLDKLYESLGQKDGFNPPQLKVNLAMYLGEKTS